MVMIRSIIRPEKTDAVLASLADAGFPAVTKVSVVGRGKQRGLQVGEIVYDELPKEMLITVVPARDRDIVIKLIMETARSAGAGAFGDGKIFVSPVEQVFTVRTGECEEEAS